MLSARHSLANTDRICRRLASTATPISMTPQTACATFIHAEGARQHDDQHDGQRHNDRDDPQPQVGAPCAARTANRRVSRALAPTIIPRIHTAAASGATAAAAASSCYDYRPPGRRRRYPPLPRLPGPPATNDRLRSVFGGYQPSTSGHSPESRRGPDPNLTGGVDGSGPRLVDMHLPLPERLNMHTSMRSAALDAGGRLAGAVGGDGGPIATARLAEALRPVLRQVDHHV